MQCLLNRNQNYYNKTTLQVGKLACAGIPDQLTIVSDSRGQYSDQFELRWTVRSASQLGETLLRLTTVRC